MNYKINEIFYSIQGEGKYAGYPAVFVRFSGCNLSCEFCDTEHKQGKYYSKEELEMQVEKLTGGDAEIIVVITGGEPCLQIKEQEPLFSKYKVHLETNGTQEIPSWIDWVTISPKTELNLKDFDKQPNELKIIYHKRTENYLKSLENQCKAKDINLYLQPLETQGKMNIKEAVDFIKKNPKFKLSLQTHKLIGVR